MELGLDNSGVRLGIGHAPVASGSAEVDTTTLDLAALAGYDFASFLVWLGAIVNGDSVVAALTIVIQGSTDGTNWHNLNDTNMSLVLPANASPAAYLFEVVRPQQRYLRAKITIVNGTFVMNGVIQATGLGRSQPPVSQGIAAVYKTVSPALAS